MKNWFLFCLVFLSFVYLSCENDHILPPATSVGYNTFGCVVDGELFKDNLEASKVDNLSYYSADSTKITRSSYVGGSVISDINITLMARNIDLEEGKTYRLAEPKLGQASAEIKFNYSDKGYTTGGDQTGEWTITKLDKTRKIISGHFWFNIAVNKDIVYKVTRGRFDINYSEIIVPKTPPF